jgi:anti-sigma factor RsiW
MNRNEARQMIHAYLDNELDTGASLRLLEYLRSAPADAGELAQQAKLQRMLREDAPREVLPEAVAARIRAAVRAGDPVRLDTVRPQPRSATARWALPMALAASLLLALGSGFGMAWQHRAAERESLLASVLSSHVRALKAGPLTQVVTSNLHTVKPWFDGKLDYSPQVRDLSAQGFVLEGGRLDVVQAHPVAALIYRRRLHAINLFQWPADRTASLPALSETKDGYAVVHWTQADISYWAISSLNPAEMGEFAEAFRHASAIPVPAPQ